MRIRPCLVLLVVASSCACSGSSGDDQAAPFDASTPDDATSDSSPGDSTAPPSDGPLESSTDTSAIDAPAWDAPPPSTKTFTESTADFFNPERGWWDSSPLPLKATDDDSALRKANVALAYAGIRLDAYRSSPIPDAMFTQWNAGLDRVRKAGIKVVLRFSYNDPSPATPSTADASESQILAHIKQLADTKFLETNADVIAVFQGGFIGQWGEWHDSTNGLDNPTSRHHIISAMLGALPASRMVQVRTPMFKADWFKAPLTDAQAFDGSEQARIGHYNDCFLASDNDWGTYDAPIDTWKGYVEKDTRYTPLGGQTCHLNPPRSDCDTAKAEMERLHWSFIDRAYLDTVINGWKSKPACYDELSRRVGYRFTFTDASYTAAVAPGGILTLHVGVKNVGFAAAYNPRPIYVVIDDGTTKRAALLSSLDARKWASGASASLDVRLRVPATAKAGTVKLALWLPDAAPSIHDDARYAIRFANDGVWDDVKGYNVITDALKIDAGAPSAPGSIDASATDFIEVK